MAETITGIVEIALLAAQELPYAPGIRKQILGEILPSLCRGVRKLIAPTFPKGRGEEVRNFPHKNVRILSFRRDTCSLENLHEHVPSRF
jgi:hypothetical protein